MKKTNTKYLVYCPECNTTFNVSEQLNHWKGELIIKFEKAIEEMKK